MSIIIVTHHFDDIIPLYTHGIILKQGKVIAQGKKSKVLSSKNLSNAFSLPVQVETAQGLYTVRKKS